MARSKRRLGQTRGTHGSQFTGELMRYVFMFVLLVGLVTIDARAQNQEKNFTARLDEQKKAATK
jgi:hypothetical protein